MKTHELLQKLTGKIQIDFKDAAAVRALTTVLLEKDFQLKVELPPDRLVPTLPLRLNYLLWIEDLLHSANLGKESCVHGVDIGTGACCIYPILAARRNNWKFTATETDDLNYESSLRTLEANNLKDSINLIKVSSDSCLQGNINLTDIQYDFTMCNPPFFDINCLAPKSRSDKRPEPMGPKSGGSASTSELAVEGGEVQYIFKLVKESEQLRANIKYKSTFSCGYKTV